MNFEGAMQGEQFIDEEQQPIWGAVAADYQHLFDPEIHDEHFIDEGNQAIWDAVAANFPLLTDQIEESFQAIQNPTGMVAQGSGVPHSGDNEYNPIQPSRSMGSQGPRNGVPFSPEEDAKLIELREKDWTFLKISQELPGRSEASCQARFNKYLKDGKRHALKFPKWTLEEDELLISLRTRGMEWKDIADELPRRRSTACHTRFNRCYRDAQLRMALFWTPEEEALLTSLVEHGMGWEDIAQQLPNKTAKVCELQWENIQIKRVRAQDV